MERAFFVDKQRNAISTIYDNIKMLNIAERTEVFRMSAFNALRVIAKQEQCFNLILIDPPYRTIDLSKLLAMILNYNLLAENGVIYCEHDPSEKLPQSYHDLVINKEINYGKTTNVTIYHKVMND